MSKVVDEINTVDGNVVKKEEKKSLKVSRRPYTNKDGRDMYICFVKGKIRGRDMEASMAPGDPGGYDILDAVFDMSDEADLVIEQTTRISNYNTGEKSPSTVFHAHSVDDNGEAVDCIIKPRQASDRQILAHFLAQIGEVVH